MSFEKEGAGAGIYPLHVPEWDLNMCRGERNDSDRTPAPLFCEKSSARSTAGQKPRWDPISGKGARAKGSSQGISSNLGEGGNRNSASDIGGGRMNARRKIERREK